MTATTGGPQVFVNASDVEASALGFTFGLESPPISTLRQDDPDIIYGDADEDFGGFTYSPFNITTKSDDEAPVTKEQLKAIHEKLDSLIQSSKTSTSHDYS